MTALPTLMDGSPCQKCPDLSRCREWVRTLAPLPCELAYQQMSKRLHAELARQPAAYVAEMYAPESHGSIVVHRAYMEVER